MLGSHRHRIGYDGPTKVKKVRNSGVNGTGSSQRFLLRENSKNPAVFTRISNVVDLS